MTVTNMILCALMLIGCSIVAYYEESTLSATVGFCFFCAILIGIGKNISAWLDRVEDKENSKPL